MKALVLELSLPKVAAAKALGRHGARLSVDGPLTGLSLRDVPEPSLPGDAWARVAVSSCGLCGTDLGFLTYKSSPSLSPWGSFPCVLGHEVLGTVVEVGRAVKTARVGDRVAIDPFLGCEVRGLPPCPSCAGDRHALCERQIGSPVSGMMLGATATLPGGFAERMVVHDSQLVPVPDALSEDVASLLEPLSVSVHAVRRRMPRPGERALVIGGGAIALTLIPALRLAGFSGDLTAVVRTPGQAELAGSLGASRALTARGEALEEELAQLTGARLYKPILGPRVAVGGFEVIYDGVGSAESLSLALRLARAGGAIVMVGAAGELARVDLAFLWAKELDLVGTLAYATEHVGARRVRTMRLAAELAAETTLPLHRLVSERVPLAGYAGAVHRNLERDRTGVVKSLLVPGGGKA